MLLTSQAPRLLLAFLLIFSCSIQANAKSFSSIKKEVESEYGIKIRFNKIKLYIKTKGKIVLKPVPLKHRKKALLNLKKDLERYSPSFLQYFIKEVQLFSYLSVRGEVAGGTYDLKRGIIYIDHLLIHGNKYPDAFHHELSSFFIKKLHSNLPQKWKKLNPLDFEYYAEGLEGPETIKAERLITSEVHESWEKGFISLYGESNFENDFNTFFGLYMSNRNRLEELAQAYPPIAKKYHLLVDFYKNLVAYINSVTNSH